MGNDMATVNGVKNTIDKMTISVMSNKEYLGELDGKSGDGDLGLSMEAAFNAINTTCQEFDGEDIATMLLKSALACNKAAPSTMGTLISSGLMSVAKSSKSKTSLTNDEIINMPRVFAEGIIARGKAKLGDKTILDALIPAYMAVEKTYEDTKDLRKSFASGAETAEIAAEGTKGMQAKIGRAKWLGVRAAEHPDAGAVLCAIIMKSLLQTS
jgi:dihydroxyacetone kinase